MQKIFTMLFIVLAAFLTVDAQVKAPAPSPASTLKQTVGLTDVEIEYGRSNSINIECFEHIAYKLF